MANHYDVAIIGSGPAGYVSAIRCAQLGLKTVCIEEVANQNKAALGGTCLNVGCVPSKALLESSLIFSNTNHNLKDHGIEVSEVSLDLTAMHLRKDKIVSSLTKGVSGLFKLNKVDTVLGKAYISDPHTIKVSTEGSDPNIRAENIILATGSRPIELSDYPFDEEFLFSSNGALKFSEVPNRIAVIGAGAIGLELGSVWARLGSEITIYEALTDFLPNADDSISKEALKIFQQQGLNIKLGTEIESLEVIDNQVEVKASNDEVSNLQVDKVIFAVGRNPTSKGLFDPALGIQIDDKEFVVVDEHCQTQVPNIYAIGDLVRGPMLAHKASEEGIMVAERIAGRNYSLNYKNIPFVIYTHPEIAWAGYSEKSALEEGIQVEVGTFPFQANARALTSNESTGFVKVVVNQEDDSIIGVHVLGPSAADVVQQGLIAMESKVTAKELGSVMFSHPTVSEALHEAVLSAKGNAIHLNNRKKK
ncbi:MAG: dihydrolipoyl dehydrogenase [SAR86 cluster bacterium]|nr:dihydrolipoyl dehydrogenase [SAR86 cluster bacterium]